MRHRRRAVLIALILTVLAGTNVACWTSYRHAACDEIEAACKALTGPGASQAVATLRAHAHSRDSFVRTQAVMVACDVGPELAEPFREQCMELVGNALDDLDGYVLHAAIPGIGEFGGAAERYIDTLLTISKTPNLSHVSFALESLGRIGLGRSAHGSHH